MNHANVNSPGGPSSVVPSSVIAEPLGNGNALLVKDPPAPQSSTPADRVLTDPELADIHAWWRAANYLAVGQIYLLDNPLLHRDLVPEDVKPRLLGHWGTTPGLNFVYAHLNRIIRKNDVDMIFMVGPGHGGPAAVASAYLDGTYPRCTRMSPATRWGCSGCSGSSPSPAAFPATSRRKHRARSTRAANWGTCSRTPTALRSTTRIWS